MDPLNAVGLAANVVQFVNFGVKIVSKGYQIYRSGDGTLAENRDLEFVTNDLIVLQTKLRGSLRVDCATGNLDKDDQALEDLTIASNQLATELLDRLNKAKAQGRHLRWKSLRQAIKSVYSKKDVDEIAHRIAILRNELELRILVSLRQKADDASSRQSQNHEALARATQDIVHIFDTRLDVLSRDFFSQKEKLHLRHITTDDARAEAGGKLLASSEVAREQASILGEDKWQKRWEEVKDFADSIIIESLLYPAMHMREDTVAIAHAKTFEWILGDTDSKQWDDFMSWLRDANGIYWIKGKAASGKSTLMKFLNGDPRVANALEHWSGKNTLVCAKYYFYNLGTPMQKTQTGLFMALLHGILSGNHTLISTIMPDIWTELTSKVITHLTNSDEEIRRRGPGRYFIEPDPWAPVRSRPDLQIPWSSWSLSSLKLAFNNLVEQTDVASKLCFFIDGLDEFDGDYDEIIAFFKTLSISERVKICLSTRPLMIFEQEFDCYPKLRLEDLTVNDIQLYVDNKIYSHPRATKVAQEEPGMVIHLVHDIVKMSSGVFLWVSLAVRSLLTGLTNFDRISDLQRRLRELPPELDDLYNLMLGNIQPHFYLGQASRLFQLVQLSHQPLSTLALSFADDEDENVAFGISQDSLALETRISRVDTMNGRVRSRCAGLLEIQPGFPHFSVQGDYDGNSIVQYLHLTVKEFLEKPEVWTKLTKNAISKEFDANVSLLRSVIVELSPENSRYAGMQHNWKLHVSSLVDSAIGLALEAENGTGVAQVSLLDELDRNVRKLFEARFTRFKTRPREQVHWVAELYEDHKDHDSFLTFAVSRGLARYVKAKLQSRATSINKASRLALLEYATTYRPEERYSSQLATVAMLLEAGMNPNEQRHRRTPWQKVLSKLSVAVHHKRKLDSLWLDICKLFTMYGATTNPAVVDLIFAAFSHLPQDSVNEIQGMPESLAPRSDGKRKRSEAKLERGPRKLLKML